MRPGDIQRCGALETKEQDCARLVLASSSSRLHGVILPRLVIWRNDKGAAITATRQDVCGANMWLQNVVSALGDTQSSSHQLYVF